MGLPAPSPLPRHRELLESSPSPLRPLPVSARPIVILRMLRVTFWLVFLPRAFKVNELKAEVANHLAVLEKRVECECAPCLFLLVL